MRTHAKFTCVNEIEAMNERPQVNVKVERGSTSTFTRDLPYIVSILFKQVKFPCACARKNYATVEIHLYASSCQQPLACNHNSKEQVDPFNKNQGVR